MNYLRMTLRSCEDGNNFEVWKLKPVQIGGYSTDMGAKRFSWVVSKAAKVPVFVGSFESSMKFIESKGAEYMSEHGINC